jgi:hypothetical protein
MLHKGSVKIVLTLSHPTISTSVTCASGVGGSMDGHDELASQCSMRFVNQPL